MEKPQSSPATLTEIKKDYFGNGFFEVLGNGDVRFLDPSSGELMEPFRPPHCIDKDPRLGEGLKFLRKLGSDNRLTVQLVLSSHGNDQNFLDIADKYGDLLKAAPAVGIEANWEGPENSDLTQAIILKCNGGGRRDFQDAQFDFLDREQKTVLPCDLVVDPNDVVANFVTAAWNNVVSTTENRDVDPITRNRARNLAKATCQFLRMWAIVAQFGLWLKAPELAHLWESETTEPVKIPLMLGSWHAATALRLTDQLGVNCETYVVEDHKEMSEEEKKMSEEEREEKRKAYLRYAEAYMAMTYEAVATLEQLDLRVPFDGL